MSIQEKILEYYEIFKGLPVNKSIVRLNQLNDAFEILVYDLLFRKEKYLEQLTIEDIEELQACIVPAPDDTIDIFYEEIDGDDYTYHIVQVKYVELPEAEIKKCFASMKSSIDSYLKDKKHVAENLRGIISASSFDEDNNKCNYYVVHKGTVNTFKSLKNNERIITVNDLETILKSVANFSVPYAKIETDKKNNYMLYSVDELNETYSAYQLNLNAHDLAILCKQYNKSEIGKNILFGQNLREALPKGSKTYEGMCATLDKEPQHFWFYNNGITIIAEEVELKENEKGKDFLELKNFSIINGAQTTSAFAKYLDNAQRDDSNLEIRKKTENLKKAFVTARVVETKENVDLKLNITIYNNTQNPISSRDMVSNNIEQVNLKKRYLDGESPNLLIQIRRGESIPQKKSFQKHQIISNEDLAQYVFAGFLKKPFTAKDKKNSLFNRDNSTPEFEINQEYSSVFNFSENIEKQGELFKRSKEELNELLFVKQLHSKAKKVLRVDYENSINENKKVLENSTDENAKSSAENMMKTKRKFKQINNVNTFYNIALYYEFKRQFDNLLGISLKKYDYNKYYKDKSYEEELVKEFSVLFNTITIKIISSLAQDDPAKFTRAANSQGKFFESLTNELGINSEYKDRYAKFIVKFKI